MALGIYTTATLGSKLSQDGVLTNPLTTMLDGRTGGSNEQKCYLHNADPLVSYSGIHVSFTDTEGTNIVNGTSGYGWKLYAGDTQPTVDQWNTVSFGNTINMSNIGTTLLSDISTYLPFWIQVSIPRNAPIATFTDVRITVNAIEILI